VILQEQVSDYIFHVIFFQWQPVYCYQAFN
jgi:hypothetical protein